MLASDTQRANFNRGIDAPESQMAYGKEAKDELTKLVQGKCLRIDVYNIDQYGRYVGDIYCNGVFVQEKLLKRGFAWHFAKHDKRPEFAKVIGSCFLLNRSILSSFLQIELCNLSSYSNLIVVLLLLFCSLVIQISKVCLI